MRLRTAVSFGFVALALGGAGAGAFFVDRAVEKTLPHGAEAARGVRIEGRAIPNGADVRAFVDTVANEMLDRPIDLRFDGDVLFTVTPREIGASVDAKRVADEALRIGREGDRYDRYMAATAAATNGVDLRFLVSVPSDALAAKLAADKDDLDERAHPARRHIGSGVVDPHENGHYLDAFAAADAVRVAMGSGAPSIELVPYELVPSATSDAVKAVDVSTVVSSFETRYGGPPGRDQNILRASGLLDGIVLMPNDEVSYNAVVGPRSVENGFAMAPEIYKGELREGVGGGACQVASTLHAAAFFGGFDVVERRNHSRPSGYIRPGLDATVSYPVLDLRIRNPYDFPVVLHASATSGLLRFEILGRDRPRTVELATETSGIFNFTRKIEKTAFLAEDAYKVKQVGKNGLSIKRTKTIHEKDGAVKVEESTDVYPATQEVILVGPKFDESTLPPLPSASTANGATAMSG